MSRGDARRRPWSPSRLAWSLAVALAVVAAPSLRAQDPSSALTSGAYDDAIRGFRDLVREGGVPDAHRGLVRALLAVGRYDDAEEAARAGVEAHGPELANALGEVLYRRGERDAAEAAFGRAADAGATDALDARLNLAVALYERGERERAHALFDAFIDVYNGADGGLGSDALTAVATAVRYLGRSDPRLFKDALRAYDEALAADPGNLEARVRLGDMLLDKYNETDARAEYEAVLETNPSHPHALLGMARALRFEGTAGARDMAERALETNPSLVPAHVLVAGMELELGNHEEAAAAVERALEVNPVSLEALAVKAANEHLRGDDAAYRATRRRVLELNPRYADLYATLAELSAQQRKYAEAAAFAEQAIELDPESWRGHAELGLNRLRLGRIAEGRASLERSFEGDPYNVWIKNTLDLVDTFDQYRVVRTPRFELVLHGEEAALLEPYMTRLAEEAYDRLTERYGYAVETPVRVEVYPNHADFSVRTVGLVGMGALGVAFGNVLSMDSPAARGPGEFNWASTLWHELAHAVHLGMTNHEVPRWFTEGLAVYEQRQARERWGHQPSPGFLQAYRAERLHPVSRLNNGFVRPSYPQQLIFSYYQASLVFELIEERWGFGAVLDMLAAYGDGASDAEVFERVLDTGIEAFDDDFDAWFRARFAGPLAAVEAPEGEGHAPPADADAAVRAAEAPEGEGSFRAQALAGALLLRDGRPDEAVPFLLRAHALFPEYTGPDSPHRLLARIYAERGQRQKAVEELSHETSRNESAYQPNLLEARLLEELGDTAGAIAALERVMEIYPYEAEVHERLATLYAQAGDREGAVRERRAIVALDPVDRADALYRLALAYHRAGDGSNARRTVLRALEAAPNFIEAQELLLELRSGSDGGGAP